MSNPKALDGITVLDLTKVLAGPYCGSILADFGAEIIKIEPPGRGDDSRSYGPHLNGGSLYYENLNRGKRGLNLNLKTEEGKQVFRRLAKQADVVIENYRPGGGPPYPLRQRPGRHPGGDEPGHRRAGGASGPECHRGGAVRGRGPGGLGGRLAGAGVAAVFCLRRAAHPARQFLRRHRAVRLLCGQGWVYCHRLRQSEAV